MVFKNCVAIALIVYEVGYLGLLLLNNLEVIPSVFKLFTRSEIFVSYFIYNLNHFNNKKRLGRLYEPKSCQHKGRQGILYKKH